MHPLVEMILAWGAVCRYVEPNIVSNEMKVNIVSIETI